MTITGASINIGLLKQVKPDVVAQLVTRVCEGVILQ